MSVTGKKTSPARKKRREDLLKKSAVIFAIAAILFGLLLYGLYRPEISIGSVEVKGNLVIRASAVENFVKEKISGKYFRIFPKKNTLIYPRKEILGDLKSNFRRIETVDMERVGFTKLVITLSERPERYLWCGRDFSENRKPSDECHFVDSLGYVFSKAPYYSGELFFEFYGPLYFGDNTNPVGGAVLTEDSFEKLISFRNSLGRMGLNSNKVFMNPDGDYEFSLSDGGTVIVGGKNDLAKSADNINLAIGADPLKSRLKKDRALLDYLDARFGNKVYFKFK